MPVFNSMRTLNDPGPPEQEWPKFRRMVFSMTESILENLDSYPLITPAFMAGADSVNKGKA